MKKCILLISLCIFSLCTIHAEISWSLSDDGTLTISGTDMPDFKYDDYWDETDAPWFSQKDKIKKVIIKDGVKNIGKLAFWEYKALTAVTISNSVTSIGDSAFYYCENLASVTFGNSLKSIGSYAFSECKSLSSITIPNSVISIGVCAFRRCYELKSAILGKSVKNIGDYAFDDCSSLSSFTIPDSVLSVGFEAIHDNTPWLKKQLGPTVYVGLVLYRYKGTEKNVVVKEGTTQIAAYAFKYSGVTSVTIPNSVTSIGEYNQEIMGKTNVEIIPVSA